jgi:hypothetical protein
MFDKILKGLGSLTGGNFLTNLAANAVTSKLLGGDTKDALMFTALQQGLGSDGLNLGNLFGGGTETAKADMAIALPVDIPASENDRVPEPSVTSACPFVPSAPGIVSVKLELTVVGASNPTYSPPAASSNLKPGASAPVPMKSAKSFARVAIVQTPYGFVGQSASSRLGQLEWLVMSRNSWR